jgi:uncharacterized membrane protein (UPF0127 family)
MAKTKNKMKLWPLYSLLSVFGLMLIMFGVFIDTFSIKQETFVTTDNSTVGSNQTKPITTNENLPGNETNPEKIYPNTKPMLIGETKVSASIAQSWPDRIKGLSGTKFLPEDTVKLFIYESEGFHSIWMKEMNYAIDIIWVNTEGSIVYLIEEATPESYPAMFVPDVPALYVIETVAGFIRKHGIKVGESVVLPKL